MQYVQSLRRTSHVLQLTNQIPYHGKDVTHIKFEMLERIPQLTPHRAGFLRKSNNIYERTTVASMSHSAPLLEYSQH